MPQSRESSHEHYFGQQHVTLIRPAGAFSMVNYGELWAYRGLLLSLAARQIRVRYKQTILGAAWAVIQPVTQMVIFSLIFGRMAKLPSEGFPYPIFVYSGLLAWNYFAAATGSAAGSLVSNAHLVSKVYFPRLIIPFAAEQAARVDCAIASLVMVGLM
ncbi:MAG: ABC transporter permease, partial [Myxococcales bacterium]|nr:ABC transporter permease [Myxococcales bacterium]